MKKTLLLLFTLVNFTAFSQMAIESFEGSWPPAGWAVINPGGTGVEWGRTTPGNTNFPPYQGTYAAFMDREDVATGVAEDWLITPQFTVPANGVISFYSRTTIAQDQSTMYEIRMSTGPNQADVGSYVLVEEFTETALTPNLGEYVQRVVNFPPATFGQQIYVAFVMKGDMGDRWLLDDVMITSACDMPANPEATNVTPTSATLAWDANDATQWEIEFVHADQPFTGQGVVITQNFYELSSIIPGNYKFIVRAICDGLASAWTEPVIFSTIENTTNVITGVVQYDATGNGGCTGDGVALPFTEIEVTIGVYTYSTYTNAQGEFTLYNLPEGPSVVSLLAVPPAGFGSVTAITQNVTFISGDTEEVINICLSQPEVVNDLSVTMSPTSSARPDFNASYMLTVSNTGTSIIDQATVTVTFDDNRLDFVSAGVPTTISANTRTFTLSDIMPFSQVQHEFVFFLLAPEINEAGDILNYTVSVSMDEADETPANNTAVLNQIVVNSLDPNDITVHEGPQILIDQADDYLTYTIRFQNMGTAEAITVKIENELDELLDADTFEPIMGSHDYTVSRTNNTLLFTFDNINLPHSGADEPGSHGYITYRIKPTAEYGLNDVITNNASIYFDSNAAITTNTVTTVVVESLGVNSNELGNIVLYPNPVNDRLNIATNEGTVLSSTIMDINGRSINRVMGNHNSIDTGGLTTGLYFVTITTDKGSSTYKIMKR